MSRFFQSSRKKFTLENAIHLCDEIDKMESQTKEKSAIMVEALRELVEVVVWGDKNQEAVFDVFLERQIMNVFAELILGEDYPSDIKVQVIQCITIMMQNLTRQQSIFFILSNNHINRIIGFPFDPEDNDLLSNVVSFFKSLSMRLNKDTIQFLFMEMQTKLPLYEASVKLLDCDDRMVRTSARQIVMNIIQIQDPAVEKYLEKQASLFVDKLCAFLCVQLTIIDTAIQRIENFSTNTGTGILHGQFVSVSLLDTFVEDIVDDLFYINDLADSGCESVRALLLPALDRSFLRTLITGISTKSRLDSQESSSPQRKTSRINFCRNEDDDDEEGARKGKSLENKEGDDEESTDDDEHASKVPPPGKVLSMIMCAHWIKVNTWKELHRLILEGIVEDWKEDIAASPLFKLIRSPALSTVAPAMSIVQSILKSRTTEANLVSILLGIPPPQSVPPPPNTKYPLPCKEEDVPQLPPAALAIAEVKKTREEEGKAVGDDDDEKEEEVDSSDPQPIRKGVPKKIEVDLASTGSAMVDVLLDSLGNHLLNPSFSRLSSFHLLLHQLFSLPSEVDPEAIRRNLWKLVDVGKRVLFNRSELYRHHMFMLYGGTGEASTLTPGSLLCQALEGPVERELVDPYEVVFIRIQKDVAFVNKLMSFPIDKLGKEAHNLIPTLPCVVTLQLSQGMGKLLPGDIADCALHAAKYEELQKKYTDNIQVQNRVPINEDEIEFVEVVQWLVLREYLYKKLYSTSDPLKKALEAYQPRVKARESVNAVELTERCGNGIRCEFIPEHRVSGASPQGSPGQGNKGSSSNNSSNQFGGAGGGVAPGTVMYFFMDGNDILIVEPNKEVPDKGTVAFALPVFYTEAVVSCKYSFRITLILDSPDVQMKVSLTFRERSTCHHIAQRIHKASRKTREEACKLTKALLNDE